MKLTANQKKMVEYAWHHSENLYIVNMRPFRGAARTLSKVIAAGLVDPAPDWLGRHSLTPKGAELREKQRAKTASKISNIDTKD